MAAGAGAATRSAGLGRDVAGRERRLELWAQPRAWSIATSSCSDVKLCPSQPSLFRRFCQNVEMGLRRSGDPRRSKVSPRGVGQWTEDLPFPSACRRDGQETRRFESCPRNHLYLLSEKLRRPCQGLRLQVLKAEGLQQAAPALRSAGARLGYPPQQVPGTSSRAGPACPSFKALCSSSTLPR